MMLGHDFIKQTDCSIETVMVFILEQAMQRLSRVGYTLVIASIPAGGVFVRHNSMFFWKLGHGLCNNRSPGLMGKQFNPLSSDASIYRPAMRLLLG